MVKVKPGFARNYLIPHGKAKRATPENVKLLEEKRAELEKVAGEKLAAAQEQAAKLEGAAIQITQKAALTAGCSVGDQRRHSEALTSQVMPSERMIRMPSGR